MRVRDGPDAAVIESSQAPALIRALTFISQYIGVFLALAALVILCGLILSIPGLQTPFPGAIPMKANAAVCFLFTGLALWLLRIVSPVSPAQKIQRYLGYFLALLTALIGLLTLLEYSFNYNPGLDQLIVRETTVFPGTVHPGRMSPFAALNFFVTGLALLMLDVKSRSNQHPSSYLIIIVGLTGLTAIIGYIYGAHEFMGVPPYTPLALDATFGFLLLFIGVLLARPTAATVVLVAGGYPGSLFIRFLIPGLIVLVILTGWLRLNGESRGYYSTELGVALFSLINIAIATTLIFLAAMRLYTAELRRRRAELEIRKLNANLEQQVTQRTGDLRMSEEKYRLIFENATEGIFQSTPQGKYISVNPAFARIGGFSSPEEMINSVADIQKEMYVNPEDRTRLVELLTSQGAVNDYEFEIKRQDGATRWVSINVRAVRDADGNMAYLEGTLVDISERKRADAEMHRAYELLNETQLISKIGGWEYDTVNHRTNWTDEVYRIHGVLKESYDPSNISQDIQFYTPQDRSKIEEAFKLAVERGEPYDLEVQLDSKDGHRLWVRTMGKAEWQNGKVVRVWGNIMDITAQKQAAAAIENSEVRYRELFDNMSSGVAVYEAVDNGEDFIFREFSHSAEILEKMRKEDIVGRSVRDVFPGVVDLGLFDVFKRVWSTGVPERHPISFYKDSRITGWRDNYVYKLPSGEIVAIYDDVTAVKMNEEALVKSESKYRSLVETAGAGVAAIALDGNLTFANQGLLEVLGYSEDEVIGRNFFDFLHPGDSQRVMEIFMKGMSDPHYKPKLEFRLLHKKGASIWFYTAPTLTTLSGVLTGASAILTNVTERKQAEEKLQQSEMMYRLLADHMVDTVWLMDMDLNTTYISPSVEKLRGYTLPELRELPLEEQLTPASFQVAANAFLQEMAKINADPAYDTVLTLELEFYRKDGTSFWSENTFSVVRDDQGKPVSILGEGRDITERKRAEQALRESEEKFRNVFDYSAIAKSITSVDGTVHPNQALADMLGYSLDELANVKWQDVSFADDIEMTRKQLELLQSGEKESARFIKRYIKKDGSIVWGDVSTVLQRDQDGRPLYYITGVIDITEHKKAEQQVKEKTLELERSNTELERFAYVASHDLQEPLRTISSYLQLLERRYKEHLDDKGLQYMDFTVSAANRLQNMISGLLEYSRVETRGQPFGPVNCETVLRQTLENLRKAIDESNAQVTFSPLPTVPADRQQLVRLFQNLLSNSIRYRGEEPPRIHVSAEQQKGDWVFAVQDNGIGIDPEYKDQIFVIFQSLHGRDVPGIGLGLSVAKRIVERHGGRIWVESRPGEGATFYFTIPSKRLPQPGSSKEADGGTV